MAAYIDNPESPYHGVMGRLGERVGETRALYLATGRRIWAADTLVRPVQDAPEAWKSADGAHRPGETVNSRLGPAEVVSGPVPTPLGIVYRLKSMDSGKEFDDWEHNLVAGGFRMAKMLSYPEVGEVAGDCCSVAEDDDGVYVKTHRSRSKSYPTFEDIPKSEVDSIATTASVKTADKDPDHAFVYHMGRLKLVEWSHDVRHRILLKELLGENGKELVDDIDDTEVVAGTVTDGKVEFEGFADPELQTEAEAAIAKELGESAEPKDDDSDASVSVDSDGGKLKIEISIDGWKSA